MSVTNTIRDNVLYDSKKDWYSEDLTNNEILEKLSVEPYVLLQFKIKAFLFDLSESIFIYLNKRQLLLRLEFIAGI